MADFNALEALINANIKKNGVQAITGNILNGILRGMVSALGKGYTIAGSVTPSSDPGTMTGPVAYIAYTAGTYTHFNGLEVEQGEVAMLIYNEAEWHKEVLFSLAANATVDGNVGTPEVGVSFVDGLLTFNFRNLKGNPGENGLDGQDGRDGVDGQDGAAAGFGTVTASVDANVGTPGVTVQTSGPNTAKNFAFQFTNLKGETGVTSCVVTVDNTSGTPSCSVSLVGQVLHLDFTGLKGAQGDTGSSVDYPFTIVNNLTTNDATQALSAAMGVELAGQVSQLEAKVDDMSTGKYYGYYATPADLPDDATVDGFAYVGSGPTYTIYNCEGSMWTSSGITVNQSPVGNNEDIDQNADGKLQFANRVYNSLQPDGMGYKIIRSDKTFAEQVTDTNTIYEIRNPFNLNNATVTIPAGSVLRFNGGKITGGSINFNGCSLEKKDSDNVFENITAFSGAVSGYFTPENVSYGLSGDCFSALLTFLKSGQFLLKVKTLTLTSDTDFNGVWLDAERIELNGYTLKLGGNTNRAKDGNLTPTKSQNQSILVIGTNGSVGNGRVIVGSCAGYELHLGLLVGVKLEFILESNAGIGYSSFYLNTVTSIELSAASGVTDAWINSNRFVLNRCVSFVVKSSLRYFNNNTIQMGCFEGAFNIRLEKGNNNYFKDIRGESVSQGRGTVYFGENTGSNVIDIMFYPYTKFYDYGRANIINELNLYRYRLIDKANISLQDLKKNLPSRIMGMSLSQDGTYMVPSNTYDVIGTETSFARYYQTGFIPYKKRMTIIAILDVIAKNEPGLAFAYELYDANFDPIFVRDSGGNAKALAMIRTTQDAYNNFKAGTYVLPFAQQTNYRPGGTHTVNNNYVVFQFNDQPVFDAIASGAEGLEEALAAVKYITISVIGSAYYYSFDSQLLSVGVSVYASEFKARLFSSDVE